MRAVVHTVSVNGIDNKSRTSVVVIDAGHGGDDPGKVGINGALEKDINLQIAKYVDGYLRQNDVVTVLTRNEDKGLYEAGDGNKKMTDLKSRMALIESSGASLAVSIHQNSYTTEQVHGAQVFYYETSKSGKRAAKLMQDCLRGGVDPDNDRTPKANKSYYLLKRSTVPTIIVESGFLSNAREAELLAQDGYQKRLAWNIAMGILQYLNGAESAVAD